MATGCTEGVIFIGAGSNAKRNGGGSLLFVLIALMGVGPLFPFMLAASSTLVVTRFDITAGQFGVLASVIFGSAALTSQATGWLADRLSIQSQLVFNFGGAAVAFGIAAFTQSFTALLVASGIVGASQAISNPTTNRVILEAVPKAKQTSWIGIKQSGVQIGQLFAGVFFPAAALAVGWIGASLAGALIAVAFTLFGVTIVTRYYNSDTSPDSAPGHKLSNNAKKTAPTSGRHRLPRIPGRFGRERLPPPIGILALVIFLLGLGVQTVNVYLPLFAVQAMGFSLIQGGLTVTVIGIVGMFARIWWARRVSRGARLSTLLLVITLGAGVGVGLLVLAKMTGLGIFVWVSAAVHGMTGLGGNVVINAGVVRAAPPGRIGQASGINSMGMYAGFTLGPLIMGWLLDWSGSFTPGWVVAATIFLLAAATSLWLRWHRKVDGQKAW